MRRPVQVLAVLLAALPLALAAQAEELLPRPAGLEPNVRFWERIYSEVDGQGGLIHDADHLDVVYEQLRFAEGQSRRSREHQVDRAKRRIRDALRVLASGRRSGLSAEQARVLSCWPTGTTDLTFRRAAENVRFQLGQADRFRAGLIRSGAWIDHIRETLRRNGVPVELAALPHVESSFNPKAYSRVGAAGLWQFTRSTGRLFLRIDSVVDERLDPFEATEAAAQLLLRNYQMTGTWPLAITAYNHGVAGVQRATRVLGTTDIVTIVHDYNSRTFGFASRNFYASFLAALSVDQRASELFGDLHRDPRVDYTVIEMPHFYRVSSLARALGVSQATLREHNAALRPAVWEGYKYVPRGYPLRVPTEDLSASPEILMARIPDNEQLARQHRDRFHKVRRGETLSRIASRYGVSMSELVALNHLRSRHRIRAGQVLTLPGGAAPPVEVAQEEIPDGGNYTVRHGDTLWVIARRFGVSQSELAESNHLHNRHRIWVGQRLRIPGAAPVVVASAAASPDTAEPAVVVAAATSAAATRSGPANATKPASATEPAAAKPASAPGSPSEPTALASTSATPSDADEAVAESDDELEAGSDADVAEASEGGLDAASDGEFEAVANDDFESAPDNDSGVAADDGAGAQANDGAGAQANDGAGAQADDGSTTAATGASDAAVDRGAGAAADDAHDAAADDAHDAAADDAHDAAADDAHDAAADDAHDAAADDAHDAAPDDAHGAPPDGVPQQVPPDPSDYAVHAGRVTVQAAETLGHYAEWLEVRTSRLRAKNHMRYGQALVIGRRLRLDFSRVTPEEFERRRLEYHRTLQDEFFSAYEVTGTERHILRRGETLWYLAQRKYRVPIWLLRQYNPDLDFASLPPGTPMVVPVVEPRES